MSRVVPKAEKAGIVFPLEYALSITASVLEGLSYAHQKTDDFGEPLSIVHRDLTPENIMVGWNGCVKILDFGIAKAASQTDLTRAGEIKGKLSYMSPEQGMGKVLDARSDLFTLGVVLYEWVTGYRLFNGENEMAILKSIIEGRIYPPSYFREDVPEPVEAILMKALAKERDERYQSGREMLLDIQAFLNEIGFVPTSAHLSTFMRQIFADEIEAERQALARAAQERKRRTPPPLPEAPAAETEAASVGEAVGRAKSEEREGAELIVVDRASRAAEAHRISLELGAGEYERLRAAAARGGVGVDEMVRDLLRQTLKYL
jgi:serine/threonine protein kinase